MGDSRHVTPLKRVCHLASTPNEEPRYSTRVKNKDGEQEVLADPRATRVLVALMDQHAVVGGAASHWGGPAAYAEIMASLHGIMFREKQRPWYEAYNFVNDTGHTENGIYALRALYNFDNLTFKDLRLFRSIESKLTGHGEAHLNPEGVFISNGPLGSGLPQAQGLAMADALEGNDRATLCTISDGGSMEGEAREAFAAIPGMAQKKRLNPFVMVISDNNTKLSGRITKDSFSMEPTFAALESQGWNVVKLEDGHDLELVHQTLDSAVEKAKNNPTVPVCVWAKTVKGYGVKSTAENDAGGHGYPLKPYDGKILDFVKEIYDGDLPEEFEKWASELMEKPVEETKSSSHNSSSKYDEIPVDKVQPGFANAAIDAVKRGLPVVSLSADLPGSTGIKPFHQEYPERSYDIGVAEANMISSAVGFSKQGFIPIVDTFAQFGTTKGNLPLIMAALSEGPVIGMFSHIGFQDAADGASHQSTTYMAAVSSIPHTQVICCSCQQEAYQLMTQTLDRFAEIRKHGETPDSVLFFYGREKHPKYFIENHRTEWGRAHKMTEGNNLTLVTSGPLLNKALKASEKLEKEGLPITVINNPFVNRPDTKLIAESLEQTNNHLMTLEDHQICGGFGSMLSHALKRENREFQLVSLGNPGEFGQSAYKADHLYRKYGMDEEGIISAVKEILA